MCSQIYLCVMWYCDSLQKQLTGSGHARALTHPNGHTSSSSNTTAAHINMHHHPHSSSHSSHSKSQKAGGGGLGFLGGLLPMAVPKYFNSEWSYAQVSQYVSQ